MTVSVTAKLRRLWFNIHLWLGVGLLVAVIPLAISGSALVWHDGLERALHPDRFAVSGPQLAKPLSAYVETANTAFHGDATLTQLRLPAEPGAPVVAIGRIKGEPGPGGRPRSLNVWIDPPTAAPLGVAEGGSGLVPWLHRLHGTLLIPQIGRKVVGWLGWAMFISCATGLWLWWPRNGAVAKGLRWRRGPTTTFNLHHMVGFWICIPLAIASLTGVYISFPQTSRALFGVAPPEAARPAGAARPGGQGGGQGGQGGPGGRFAPPVERTALTLDRAAALALDGKAGAQLVSISVPTRGKDPAWRVQIRPQGAKTPSTVQVVDASGVVKADRSGGGPDPLSRWMRRIHDGDDMGIVWQIVVFLGGLAPPLLGITGLIMWLRGRKRRVALRPAPQT
ncbi:MAG: PepSY-associated TM helix domain-containing protein [Phenylobacterium sp.]|uniref:PepSY-associated TM helix domain-containing protein n=1 Tax=Phenylobacterium sp. TaxID=1871053 RepID=UPI00273422AD|nr:PepSY-associated TM helix domain-containing protein [Phenylobacterium sp.]MDP3175365.1 PepSY-associated TM helix domain-containing protein [Phenylobacterium sp.]